MFKYLHTNLPSSIMAFPEFKFPPSTSQFPTKDDIANYLDSYCHHFNLYPYIHLQHIVKHLSFESEKNQWKVVVNSLIENIEKIEYFDAVIIANGHYNKPYIPTIKGLENCNNNSSKIKLIHSHSYREPTPYKNKVCFNSSFYYFFFLKKLFSCFIHFLENYCCWRRFIWIRYCKGSFHSCKGNLSFSKKFRYCKRR
mgnify:CR=1 FL=1